LFGFLAFGPFPFWPLARVEGPKSSVQNPNQNQIQSCSFAFWLLQLANIKVENGPMNWQTKDGLSIVGLWLEKGTLAPFLAICTRVCICLHPMDWRFGTYIEGRKQWRPELITLLGSLLKIKQAKTWAISTGCYWDNTRGIPIPFLGYNLLENLRSIKVFNAFKFYLLEKLLATKFLQKLWIG